MAIFFFFLVRPKKRNINKCWLTFLKNKKQLKYVQKKPNGVWFQLLKDTLTGIARQSRLLHWILIYQYLYMDKNLCKLSQSTNLQKTPRGWSQILIQHSMPLLHEFKCFFTFSLFHIFRFFFLPWMHRWKFQHRPHILSTKATRTTY